MNLQAVWGRLIVLPDDIEETDEAVKSAKSAIPGFEIVDGQEKERLQSGQIEGTLLSVGGNCFEDWKDPKPEIGSRVVYDKYAGFEKKANGKKVRIISDTDILAIIGE